MKILFASNNYGKYAELADDFKKVGIDLIYDGNLKLDESSGMLLNNAITKAKSAAIQRGMIALGDDSGIFIEGLDFYPGVHSRRWFGEEEDDNIRNKKIISLMSNETNRKSTLITRFALFNPEIDNIDWICSVSNLFSIASKIIGSNGFGYDPILKYVDHLRYKFTNNHLIPLDNNTYKISEIEKDDLLNLFPNINYFIDDCGEFELFIRGHSVGEMNQEQKNYINNRGRIAAEISALYAAR